MRRSKSMLLGATALLLASAGQANAAITYLVNAPVGSGGIAGSITTDGTLGALVQGNFLSWTLLITGAGGVSDTLTQLNSAFFAGGSKTTADATNLYFDFTHDDAAPSYLLVQKNFSSGSQYACAANATYALTPCYEGSSAVPVKFDHVSASFGSPSGNQVIGTVAPVVPEPASWAMMIVGLGTVGVAMRRREDRRVQFA